ncbi:ABC transporter ATP-binding protein [Dehalococcoides sp. THU3]|uniref:ABC transporter ATP-binding protein n=1 Tax=Dehalococcoides TaxID=61434 RepID=UPI0005B56AB6|nr:MULTISPECIES: ABC transporter ATP-binding protein [Dehalococcoides]QYY57888.1 ABC transporter ATP-binding protein [Dehalococcoides mccartyi]BAQ34849.1 oligopeptide ABC transporter ATP binding protein [Dehalococcoides sp. UCH007]
MAKLLEVKNLVTHFMTQDGIVQAVSGVSFEVNKGEMVALVGESGCGKTVSSLSVLQLIPQPPGKIVAGQVLFNGVDLLKKNKEEMQKIRGSNISMIFQEPMTSLNPVLTIGRQLTEGLQFHLKLNKNEATRQAVELLKSVGIPHAEGRLNDYPHHFSGGMRQRVMIAMALACEPQLVIADEPTTAVDVTIQAQLLDLIRSLTLRLNTALIIITHNLGVVARYAQRVYVMYAGQIMEQGTAIDVYHKPLHPYTAGLLGSVPRLDEPRRTRLQPIDGQPPDLIGPPQGCPFAPRCVYVKPECKIKRIPLIEIKPGHLTACLVAQEGALTWEKI